MSTGFEDYARDIEDSMYRDMRAILNAWMGKQAGFYDLMVDDLVSAGMFHVKHLLVTEACAEQREAMDR